MASLGKLHEFKPDEEEFATYLERVEIFFAANGVEDTKKVPVFLNAIGGAAYGILRSLVAPSSPMSLSFKELTETLQAHYEPKTSIIAERFHFHKRSQHTGESITDFVAELRRLAARCKFEGYLDDALRDRFVCGLRNEAIQRSLLAEKELTYASAVERAKSMEAAHANAQALKTPALTVGKVDRPVNGRSSPSAESRKPCHRCGKVGHTGRECRYRDVECHKCKKKGHLAKVCRSSAGKPWKRAAGKSTQWVGSDPPQPNQVNSEEVDLLCCVNSRRVNPYTVVVELNGKPVSMEIDTGAAVSLVSRSTQTALFPHAILTKPKVQLRTYTAEPISLVGKMAVEVKHNCYTGQHDLYVVEGSGPSLIGRDWLSKIRLDWASIRAIADSETSSEIDSLLQRYPQVFQSGPGLMRHIKASLTLKPDAKPRFCRPRSVPFSIKPKVGQELDRLEEEGVLQKVNHSVWAAPIVPVPKRDGSLRICGDYKVTINPFLLVDQYPLPKPSDLMACLTGGKRFSKMDLMSAYQQMKLDDESAKLVTINTHQGLYEFTRLPFGVASAPAVFQRAMDTVLQGIPHCICYLDDILVTGRSDKEHLRNLEEVLSRLRKYGIRLKEDKCQFLQDSVEYLGHQVDAEGVHTSPKKVEAILKAPRPRNLPELRSFLGLLNYYAKFLSNLSCLLHPLHELLRADHPWHWSEKCERVFQEAKESLSKAPVLMHYDPELPLILAADASSYGLGAVISHRLPNGSERPVAYASRTLASSERNYAQVEKEALSLIFGVKRFHQYLYGRHFLLMTDHKPLTSILGPKNGIPPLAAARMQRWALLLSAYTYDIQFRGTKLHANADALSRLPLMDKLPEGNPPDPAVFNVAQLDCLPVHAQEVAAATRVDSILSKLLHCLRKGWPTTIPDYLIPFWRRKEGLGVEGDCILWGCRVVIPQRLQQRVLDELHQGHPGVVRMKMLARGHVWWPGLDKAIEQQARECHACQASKNSPARAPLHSWAWPSAPWERIHIDYAGPIFGKMLLIIVDAHTKWIEVCVMSSTTSSKTILALRDVFARYGLPRKIVSDNGPQFSSDEFRKFMLANGIKHTRTAPYHPSSNGAAERAVQTVKRALQAAHRTGSSLEQSLAAFLLQYRTTPQSTTGVAPCMLMMGRDLRTRMHLIAPDVGEHVRDQQDRQQRHHDQHSRTRGFSVGTSVWARNFRDGSCWVKAVIADQLGPVSYLVQLENGDYWRRHVDHLRPGSEVPPTDGDPEPEEVTVPLGMSESQGLSSPTENEQDTSRAVPVAPSSSNNRRYPSRVRKPPDRLYGTLLS